jgi:hypothetical protein
MSADSSQSSYVYQENGLLPPGLKAQLANWPASGSGDRKVHRHMMTVANALRHYVTAEQAVELIRASMPRRGKGREIEDTVARAYNMNKTVPKKDRPPNHVPHVIEIENIVADHVVVGKSALAELEASSPAPIPSSTEAAMYQLFKPVDLICYASDCSRPMTRELRQIILGNQNGIAIPELVVPNPMSERYIFDDDMHRHYRTLANTGPRKFIVCDIDIQTRQSSLRPPDRQVGQVRSHRTGRAVRAHQLHG